MSQLNVQNRWRTPSEAGEKITWLSSSENVKGDTSEGSVVALGFQTAVALKTGDYSNDHNFTDMVGFDSPRQKIGMAGQIGRALRAFIEPTGRTESNNISNKPNNFNHYNKTSQDSKENIDKHHSLLCALRDFLGEQESVVLFDTSQLVKDQEEQMSEDVIGAEGSLQHSGTSAGAVVPVKEEEGGQQAYPEGPSTAGSAALSPASLYSTEFCSGPYTFQQFDCQSDCTESTGYFPTTPKSSSVVVTNRKRSKSCSLDSVFSDFASPHRQHQQQRHQQSQSDPASELWESDISIFNKSSESANYFVLPSPGAESDGAQSSADCHTNKMPTATDSDSAVESSDQRGTGIGDSDSGTSGRAKVSAQSSKSFSSGASAGDLSTTSMPSATPVYAERSEDSSSSSVEEELPNAPTDDATRAPLPSSQRQRDRSSLRSGEVCPVIAEPLTPPALQAHGTSDANTSAARTAERAAAAVKKIDLLVLPTALPDDARSCVYTALSTLDVQVQRVQSSAAALVSEYLNTVEAKQRLLENSGYLRLMVIETSAGIVTASVVSVESPLQADLPFLNNIGVSSAVAASPSDIDRAEYVLSNSSYLSADSAAAPPPAVVGSGCDNGGVAPSSNAATAPSAFVPPTPTSTPLETGMRSAPPPLLQAQDPPVRSAVVRLESTVWSASCCSEEEGKEALSAGYVTVPSDTASSCGDSSADGAIRKTGLKGDDTQDQSPVGVDRGLRRCIKAVMSQQAAANSPYATADHQKLHAQHQAKERKHSYRSIELDERMFGCDGAAQLQEEENARAAAALASLGERRSAAVSIIDNAGRKDAMSPSDNTPIPVLDAVLFWTESVETEELQVGGQAQLLADIQGIVIPYLRNVVDDLQITEDKLLTADDTYAPASVPAASAKRGTRGRPSAGRRSSQLPPIPPPQPRSLLLPLFLMPPSAVLQGAFAMQAARRDILRIFECPHVQQYRDGGGTPCGQSLGVVIRKIRAPVVGKASLREAGREAELGEISEDQVIWLYKPAVTAAGKESASAKVSEASDTSGGAVGSVEVPTWMQRRDRSVSLVIRPEKCATKTAAGSATADHTEVRVVAERSVTSLRTCTFKPNRSVASLVLSPPPDTACLILPNSSCYSQAPNAGDDDTSGVNESLLVYRGGVGGIECPDGVLAQREGARQSLCFAGWCAGAYEVLHYLFFPGTTCFIQYLQTDVAVNSPATLSAETQTVHAATSQPTISEASTAATAAGSVQWELLVVANDGSAAAGTFDRKGLRVLRTIPLPCVPTLCEKLISLEQQKQKPGRGTSATEVMELFPTCMVELTAAGNSGLRALSVIAVCGAADVADSNAPAATCSKPTQPVHMASRKRRSPPTEKNHYIALSMGSFKLLRQRAHLQARLSAVRGALRSLFAIVLLIVAALVAAVLVEYAYMQLQRQRPPPLPTRQETAPPTVIEDPFNVERLAAVPDALMVPDDHKVAMSSPVDFTFQDRPEDVDTTADTQAKAETEIAPTKEAARVDHEAVLEFIAAVEQQCERQNGRASVDPSPVVDSLDIAFGHPEDDSSPAMEPTLQSVPSLVAEKEKEEEAFLSVQPTQEHRKDECAAVVPSELAPESELPVAVPLVAVPVPVEYLRMPAEPAVEEEYLTILPSEPSQSDEMWQAPNIVFEPECRAFVTDYMLGDSFAAEQVVRTDAGAALEIRPAAFLADRGADLGTNVVGVKVAPEEHEQHTCISTDPASESSMDDNQLAPGGTVHHTVNMGMDNMGIDVDIGMGDLRLGTEEQADLLLADTQHALPNTFPRIESARDTVRTAVRALHPYYNRYLRRHHERWIDALRSTATYTDREVRRGARYIADSPMAQTLYANAVLLAEFVSANVRHYVPIFYYALYLDKLHRAAEDAYAAATPHVQMAYAYCEHQTAIFGEAASTLWHSVYQSVSEFLHDLLTATRTVGAKLSRSMCELRRGADAVQESTLLYCAGMQRGLQDIVNRTAALLGTLLEGQKELWRNYVTAG